MPLWPSSRRTTVKTFLPTAAATAKVLFAAAPALTTDGAAPDVGYRV